MPIQIPKPGSDPGLDFWGRAQARDGLRLDILVFDPSLITT